MAELDALKERLKATWTAGDYGFVARGLQKSAEAFVAGVQIAPGERVLDVACGTGQVAIPAARSGAQVTGIDIAENWIAQARERAAEQGLDIRFDVGDVEDMPYDDASFDVVVSLIGAMFAPRPDRALSEMARVCRPGGRIIMGNWTPQGFVGTFFKTVSAHVPPPDMPSPLLWGDEDTVRERLAAIASEVTISRQLLHFDYPMLPAEVATHYFRYFGPTRQAMSALDPAGQDALRRDMEALWSSHNQADDGTTQVDGEILEIIATRR